MKHSTRGIPKFPQVSLRRDKGHEAVSIPSFRILQSGKFSLLLRAAKGIPKFPQVFLQRDKGHEAVSVPSLYPFLRVRKKTLFEGTLRIPSLEKIRLRDIPKFPQVSLRREKGHEAVSVPSLYPFLRVSLPLKGHYVPLLPKKYVLGISLCWNKKGTPIPKKGIR